MAAENPSAVDESSGLAGSAEDNSGPAAMDNAPIAAGGEESAQPAMNVERVDNAPAVDVPRLDNAPIDAERSDNAPALDSAAGLMDNAPGSGGGDDGVATVEVSGAVAPQESCESGAGPSSIEQPRFDPPQQEFGSTADAEGPPPSAAAFDDDATANAEASLPPESQPFNEPEPAGQYFEPPQQQEEISRVEPRGHEEAREEGRQAEEPMIEPRFVQDFGQQQQFEAAQQFDEPPPIDAPSQQEPPTFEQQEHIEPQAAAMPQHEPAIEPSAAMDFELPAQLGGFVENDAVAAENESVPPFVQAEPAAQEAHEPAAADAEPLQAAENEPVAAAGEPMSTD